MRVKSSGMAPGWQIPGPRAVQNLQKKIDASPPGHDKAGKCPAVARGGRGLGAGGID